MYKKRAKMKGKKAVSEIVSYILLISLALGMSALVYSWLKTRIGGVILKESCPEGVNLVLESYNCINDTKTINITIKNRGLFTVSGFLIKMNNISTGIAGMYPICKAGTASCDFGENKIACNITPLGTANDIHMEKFDYTKYNVIRQVEIEPMWNGSYCDKAITSSAVRCP